LGDGPAEENALWRITEGLTVGVWQFHGASIFGVLSCLDSVFLGCGLVADVGKSGRLDRRK
jgi:hypothetical protein